MKIVFFFKGYFYIYWVINCSIRSSYVDKLMNTSDISVQVYLVDPIIESRDPGEDGGFLVIVTTQYKDKAGDAMNLPGTLRVLTVQGATRVTLDMQSQPQTNY